MPTTRIGRASRDVGRAGRWTPDEHPRIRRSRPTTCTPTAAASLLVAAAPDPQHAAGLPHLVDAARLGSAALQRRHPLVDWLEAKGIGFDVVTDEDLDAEGAALLAPYRVVLTGTPSRVPYARARSKRCSDYIARRRAPDVSGRQRLLLARRRQPGLPGVIEIRRGRGRHPRLGGRARRVLSRARRRDTAACGVATAAPPQRSSASASPRRAFEARHYRRTARRRRPARRVDLRGVERRRDRRFRPVGGGAAGFELDRADAALGTPPQRSCWPRSEGHDRSFMLVNEELLVARRDVDRRTAERR